MKPAGTYQIGVPVIRDICLLVATLDDGCRLEMKSHDGNPQGWHLNLFHGFEVECPHGFKARVTLSSV